MTNKHSVDIAIQDPQWEELKNLEGLTKDVISRTLRIADIPAKAMDMPLEISVVYVNDDMIQVLNREYRGKDKATNVLSFAMLDDDDAPNSDVIPLGDIILSFDTIHRESQEKGCFMDDHVAHLLVHGLLHLLGYDHIEDDDATTMETLEIRILEGLNIQNPYLERI